MVAASVSGVYYNENDRFTAQWLRNLIAAGLLLDGDVDERSIRDVSPDDVRGYRHAHFFAGIGGWPLALEIAGWPDDCAVWTGSCPCQPYSVAGQHKGENDARDLWPVWYRLIAQCRPNTVFGEQVPGAISHEWFDRSAADLEELGYAVAACVLPACSVGAPHRRDRFWFVADGMRFRLSQPSRQQLNSVAENGRDGAGYSDGVKTSNPWSDAKWMVGADGKARRVKPDVRLLAHGVSARVGKLRALGNAIVPQVAAEFVKAFMEIEA